MERTVKQEPSKRRTAFISWRWLAISTFLIIAAIAAGVLIANSVRGSKVDRGSKALIEAFSKQRLIEPRLSGGFKSGEFRLSNDTGSGVLSEQLERARDLITGAASGGDLSADHPYARLLLSTNDDDKLTEALKYLHRVAAREPESAEVHNDIGVCFIQQGRIDDAIDEFDTALKHRSEMPEALFNRALSYQRLLLRDAAKSDFSQVAELDPDKSWVSEIEHRIEELSHPVGPENSGHNPVAEFDAALAAGRREDAAKVVAENSEALRTHALWSLTVQHLQSAVDGDPEQAQRKLSEMELIGGTLVATMRDSVTTDLANYLRDLPDSSRRAELPRIKDYVNTSKVRPRSDKTNAVFERLEKEFRASGNNVFEALATFKVADYYYASKRFEKSLDKLKPLLSYVESREWPFDRARFLNVLALETSRLGQDSLAIKYFERAVELCSSESPDLESRILQYMAVPYIQVGDIDRALDRLRDSTKLMLKNGREAATLENLAFNYSQIAEIYSLRKKHAVALLCAGEALSYAERAKKPAYAAEFSSFLAVENARLNHTEQAEASLKRAFEFLKTASQDSERDATEARVLINAIQVATQRGDTERAIGYYPRAQKLAKLGEGHSLLMIDLLRAHAGAYLASGQIDKARSSLLRAVTEIERYRANIATSAQRSHFLDASHSVFDQLIYLDAGLQDRVSEAVEMSERSRARALLDEISRATGATEDQASGSASESASGKPEQTDQLPLSFDKIRPKLPEDLTVLEYSVTAQGSYLFLITQNKLIAKLSPATTETLGRLTQEYITLLRNLASIDEVNEKARELYDYLIKPVENELAGVGKLCIIPDKALHFLPFAGLLDGNDRYLFKSHSLSYAPSASVLIRCLEKEQAASKGKTDKILTVGDPRFNIDSFPNLKPLDDAEREADRSAKFYDPNALTLKGAQATEPQVRSAMRECDVAHLAVHCLVDESSPWLAALLLAGSPNQSVPQSSNAPAPPLGGSGQGTKTRSAALSKALPPKPVADPNDGMLFLNELYGMRLPYTRLVVLSACQSALGQYYRGEGIVSLVRPLLAAGVPTIVASLWAVDSKATSDLMIEFHKQRTSATGISAAEALRQAQMELSRTYEHPYYWAPFIAVGGSSASR